MANSKGFVVTGIGTDVGKTIVSAILTKALNAAYWKPIQSGAYEDSDANRVMELVGGDGIIFENHVSLKAPLSPHIAAQLEGVEINPDEINIPDTDNILIVEGAGGLLVPLNIKGIVFADLFQKWNLPVILVVRHYLGSINHTLLSLSELKQRDLQLAGIVYVGEDNFGAEEIIHTLYSPKVIGRIPIVDNVNTLFIQQQANKIKLQNHW